MAKRVLIIIFCLVCLTSYSSYAQISSFDVKIFSSITTLDFGNLAILDDLIGAQQIFLVEIEPWRVDVRLKGKMEWYDPETKQRREFGNFLTYPFKSRNFYNTDLGNTEIRMDSYIITSSVVDEIIKRGKPTGIFYFTLSILHPTVNSVYKGPIERRITFLNPSQSLLVISPMEGKNENPNSVLVQWTPVNGIKEYLVKANVRTNPNQSFEEALNSGNPVVNNISAGTSTSILLNPGLLSRQWASGDEIVLQVAATVEGPGGGNTIYSNITNFYLTESEAGGNEGAQNSLVVLLSSIGDSDVASEIVKKLVAGNIKLTGKIIVDGVEITNAALIELLNKLAADPDLIIKITPPQN